MDDKDRWWQSMLDLQTDICRRYVTEVAKLRKENAELQRQLAAYPADATLMQDRVTMLEGLCSRNPAPNAAQPGADIANDYRGHSLLRPNGPVEPDPTARKEA